MPLIVSTPYRQSSLGIGEFVYVDGGLYGRGSNAQGQLGRGYTSQNSDTRNYTLEQIGTDTSWSIPAGGQASAAIKSDGTLWTWGDPGFGALGRAGNNLLPAQVTSTAGPWKQAAIRGQCLIALKTDGTLWVCGLNNNGLYGDKSSGTGYNATLKQIPGNWTSFSHGGNFVHAIKSDGSLWSWGSNSQGQLGRNGTGMNTDVTYVPGLVNNTRQWKKAVCGGSFWMGIDSDGNLFGGGSNSAGQMRDTTWYDRFTGVRNLNVSNVRDVSCGDNFAVILKTDGTAWAWGGNESGQLSRGNTSQDPNLYYVPVQMSPKTDWKKAHANSSTSMLLDNSGQLYAAGAGFLNLFPGESYKSILTKLFDNCKSFSFGDNVLFTIS